MSHIEAAQLAEAFRVSENIGIDFAGRSGLSLLQNAAGKLVQVVVLCRDSGVVKLEVAEERE